MVEYLTDLWDQINSIRNFLIFGIPAIIFIIGSIITYLRWDGLTRKAFWCSVPVIGKISNLSTKTEIESEGAFKNWHGGEKEISLYFYHNYIQSPNPDPQIYNDAMDYLKKVGDIGRETLGVGWKSLLIVIFFVEAFGLGLVYSQFVATSNANQTLLTFAAIGVAILFAIVLVFLTHAAGKSWYNREVRGQIIKAWKNDKDNPNRQKLLQKDTASNQGKEKTTDFDKDDDEQPHYVQMVNRLDFSNALVENNVPKRYFPWIIVLAAAFVIFIAGLTYWVRSETYNIDKLDSIQLENEYSDSSTNNGLPSAVGQAHDLADGLLDLARQSALDTAAKTTYIALFIVFLAIQFIGGYAGYKYSFVGEQSNLAYKFKKFESEDTYINYYDLKREQIKNVANDYLAKLQAKMSSGRDTSPPTFDQFIKIKEAERDERTKKWAATR